MASWHLAPLPAYGVRRGLREAVAIVEELAGISESDDRRVVLLMERARRWVQGRRR